MRWITAIIVVVLAAGAIWYWTAIQLPEQSQDAASRPEISTVNPSTRPANAPAADASPSPVHSAERSPSGQEEPLTPAQLALTREVQERLVEAMYGDLERELGLTPAKADAMRAHIVDHRLRELARPGMHVLNGNTERASSRQLLEGVATLLDPEQAARFEEFHRSVDARAQIMLLGMMLEESQLPLSEGQRRDFIHAAIRNGAYLFEQDIPATDSQTQFAQEYAVRSEQRDQLLLKSARGVLSPAQFQKVEAYIREQDAALNQALYVHD